VESESPISQPIEITDDDFDAIIQQYDVIAVDFWAPWCGPCNAMAPVIEELAQEYAGSVVFAKINTDENPSTTERFQVMGIPTLVLIQGGNEIDRIVGAVPKQDIRNVLNSIL
jgi:thioredoxin